MPEQIYPKELPPLVLPPPKHRWLNRYCLLYDNGEVIWGKSYRTKLGSSIAGWYHYHIGSWGGSVIRTDQRNLSE